MMQHDNQPVLLSTQNSTGVITLNRSKALNSINAQMVELIDAALRDWEHDPAIEQVIIESNSKHFCAGGDVKAAREGVLAGEHERVDQFFIDEYAMNMRLARFPKPVIALVSGVNMGGGFGLSTHGSHMVVAEDVVASMPEMNIGFVTDVGQTWKLQRLPHAPSQSLGCFLGLTGYRMNADDLVRTGLATHKVATLEGVRERLIAEGVSALDGCAVAPQDSEVMRLIDIIEGVFVGSWEEIRARLDTHVEGKLRSLVADLTRRAAPSSLVASAELFTINAGCSLEQAFEHERVLGNMKRREPDFVEGVRAVLVEKGAQPDFAPAPSPEKYREALL